MVIPLDGLPPVPGLEITPGFQCNVPRCSLEAGGRSQNWQTILRHMKKEHQLLQGNDSMIKEVGLETFPPLTQLTYLKESLASSSLSEDQLWPWCRRNWLRYYHCYELFDLPHPWYWSLFNSSKNTPAMRSCTCMYICGFRWSVLQGKDNYMIPEILRNWD